ncbi:colicin E3/pyocin S6 family cytotoxin [Nocardiopsis metallicus]|uniref:Flp pilus assembly pilin Flp n=1 Tax=Nocardiopsis metallicus TaxID=179819 RepID=A0A840WZT7_9ACTN|nr:colicin E3/pyocin S6 family cytotoxin [Nocardiopsis metallicus]MBB5495728.1 Flp pilus assembly pilin Flp [Nocardiopsis metallicus]
MLRRIHDSDRGASFIEYAAVIALVGAVIATLLVSGIPRRVSDGIAGAVDDALNGEGVSSDGAGPDVPWAEGPGVPGTGGPDSSQSAAPEREGSYSPETGESDFSEHGSSGGVGPGTSEKGRTDSAEGIPDPGLPEPFEFEPAPYNPEEHAGGATPAVWNGSDDFSVQQTLSWGDFWGNGSAFTFEDRGDYNWYCGEIAYNICYFGGGVAQGAVEVYEDSKNTACHFGFFCSYDEQREALSETGEGVGNLLSDPWGSVKDMAGDFWSTPERNRENISERHGPFWKDSGYWIPRMVGAPLKPFRIIGGNSNAPTGESRGGPSCVTNSFAPGTLIVLADGTTKPIELVEVGDHVLATDPVTGEEGPREVSDTIIGSGVKMMVEITVDTTTQIGAGSLEQGVLEGAVGRPGPVVLGDAIIATGGHPFWSPERDAWVNAVDLAPGMWLLTPEETLVQVSGVKSWEESTTVYNLTVQDINTYYVLAGDTPVLVHNVSRYKPAPEGKVLPGFPDAEYVGKGTNVRGGGGRRDRWELPDGRILEWDAKMGTVEMWTNKKKNAKHMGEFDPDSGNRLPGNKGLPVRGRKLGGC